MGEGQLGDGGHATGLVVSGEALEVMRVLVGQRRELRVGLIVCEALAGRRLVGVVLVGGGHGEGSEGGVSGEKKKEKGEVRK